MTCTFKGRLVDLNNLGSCRRRFEVLITNIGEGRKSVRKKHPRENFGRMGPLHLPRALSAFLHDARERALEIAPTSDPCVCTANCQLNGISLTELKTVPSPLLRRNICCSPSASDHQHFARGSPLTFGRHLRCCCCYFSTRGSLAVRRMLYASLRCLTGSRSSQRERERERNRVNVPDYH